MKKNRGHKSRATVPLSVFFIEIWSPRAQFFVSRYSVFQKALSTDILFGQIQPDKMVPFSLELTYRTRNVPN
jgi:hypothetical protein